MTLGRRLTHTSPSCATRDRHSATRATGTSTPTPRGACREQDPSLSWHSCPKLHPAGEAQGAQPHHRSHTQVAPGFPARLPEADGLVSRRRGGGTKMGREGERHLLLIAPSCGQAAPISAARSCSRQGAGAPALPAQQRAREQEEPLVGTLLHPQALHRDFSNYIYTLSLSARAAIMPFIIAAAASAQGQLIGDEIFAAMAEYKVPPSALRIIIAILSA